MATNALAESVETYFELIEDVSAVIENGLPDPVRESAKDGGYDFFDTIARDIADDLIRQGWVVGPAQRQTDEEADE